jgi:type IV secretory pathway TraG/TraD family ATPase VirD4
MDIMSIITGHPYLSATSAATAAYFLWALARGGRPDEVEIEIGGVPIPPEMEARHILTVGSTGVGKTQMMLSVLTAARERGDRVVVVDAGGDIMSALHRDGDVILHPMDARSVAWSPFADLGAGARAEVEALAKSIIPDSKDQGGSDGEWRHYCQTLLTDVLVHLGSRATNRDLVDLLILSDLDRLAQSVEGTPSARMFAPGAERMMASVMGIIGTYIGPLAMLPGDAGRDAFSLRSWASDEGAGWLWIPYRASTAQATQPLRRAWVDILSRAVLDLRPSRDRRLWLVLDEIASVGFLPALPELAERARKYGLRIMMGMQSVAQLRDLYGREQAQSVMSCAGTWLVLRVGDHETAKALEDRLGQQEVVRKAASENASGGSVSEQYATRPLVLASEIMTLPDRHGFLVLPGDFPIARVVVPIVETTQVIEPFSPVAAVVDSHAARVAEVVADRAAAAGVEVPVPALDFSADAADVGVGR